MMTQKQQILDILTQAKQYGLQWEVEEWAGKFRNKGYDPITSYQLALNEWVK